MGSKVCPKCGSQVLLPHEKTAFICGSFIIHRDGKFVQSNCCKAWIEIREKDARIAALEGEVERLQSLLAEAHEAVCSWGAYADDYFQKKWNLQGDIDKFAPFEQFYPKEEPRSPEETQAMIDKYIAQATRKEPPCP